MAFISDLGYETGGPTLWLSVIEDFSGYTLHATRQEAVDYCNQFDGDLVIQLALPDEEAK